MRYSGDSGYNIEYLQNIPSMKSDLEELTDLLRVLEQSDSSSRVPPHMNNFRISIYEQTLHLIGINLSRLMDDYTNDEIEEDQ